MTGSRPGARLRWGVLLASVVALVSAARPARALEVVLASSRNEVTVGEQFTVSVEVRQGGVGRIPQAELPQVAGLRQAASYSSQNFSYVNGRATSSVVQQIVMVADVAGQYTIGPARAGSGNDAAQSGTVIVTVKPVGSSTSVPRLGAEVQAQTHEGRDLIVLGEVDNREPWVNQQITYTFTFLRRVNPSQSQYTPPAVTGFWTEDLGMQDPREVVVDGRRYIAERARTALFPTGPGEYTIGEAYVHAQVADARRGRRDPFDLFNSDPFGVFGGAREVVLKTEPITVRVRPLPEDGKPANFSGAVGRFELTADVDRKAVKAGEPVTLTMKLSGEGNVKVVPAPDLSKLEGFKVYQSKSDESSRADGDKIHGEKKWEYVLVPTGGGAVEIPPVKLAVFDPTDARYVELATSAISLSVEVTGMEEALARGGDPSLAKERVRLRERDIRYVKPARGNLRHEGSAPWTRPDFLLLHAVPALAFAGTVAMRRHRDRLRSDVRYARRRGAMRKARTHLDAATGALGKNLEKVFAEVSTALRGYVADRFHLAAANLEEAPVREGLASLDLPPESADAYFEMLAACDGARFSPLGSDAKAAAALIDRARHWITQAERR